VPPPALFALVIPGLAPSPLRPHPCALALAPSRSDHCPGAVLLLFETRDGRVVLHTGDFRYEPSSMALHPAIRRVLQARPSGLDVLYLDTTYLKPQYRFPTQAAVVQHVVDTCRLLQPSSRTLVLFGSYAIGKERVFLQVARELNVPIHVERTKMRLLECMQLPCDDKARLFSLGPDGREEGAGAFGGVPARWRVVPMAHLRAPKLRALLAASRASFDAIVAFRPTGWCFGGSSSAAGRTVKLGKDLSIVEVPYSEHSSFDELRMCVRDLRPQRIVATVNGGPHGQSHPGMQLLR
jgi:DNA cross-link repair 1A protein